MFPDMAWVFRFMMTLLIIFIPLGLWKFVEIVIWLFSNVSVNVGG